MNEDPNVKLIRDLKSEIENLKQFIHVNQLQGDDSFLKEHDQMKAKLVEKEGQISELSKVWVERWQDLRKAMEVCQLNSDTTYNRQRFKWQLAGM